MKATKRWIGLVIFVAVCLGAGKELHAIGNPLSVVLWLLKMQCVGEAISKKNTLSESHGPGEGSYCTTTLEMGVKNDLRHGQNTTGLQRGENLLQSRFPIGDFAQHRYQQCPIKPVLLQLPLAESGTQELNVVKIRCLGLLPRAIQHAGLEIQSDYHALLPDLFRDGHRQPSWAAARIQDGHAWLKPEMLDDYRRTIGLREGIIQFNEPSQPYRAR